MLKSASRAKNGSRFQMNVILLLSQIKDNEGVKLVWKFKLDERQRTAMKESFFSNKDGKFLGRS